MERISGEVFDHNVPIRIDTQVIAAWNSLPVAERRKKNRECIKPYVIKWEDLCEKSLPYTPHDCRLFYLHVPKTGGTTLQYLLAKNYRINDVLHVNAGEALRNPAVLYKKGDLPKSVLMGHYDMSHLIYQAFNTPFVHLTLLRHPVSRALSYYNYLKKMPNNQHHQKAISKSFQEFVQSEDVFELNNGQTKRLAGFMDLQAIGQPQREQEILEIAKANLVNYFSFFGLQERYTEFLLMARQLLGWPDIFHRRHNVSEKQVKKEEIGQEILADIRERNSYDLALYDFASELFEQRCRQLEITQKRVECFRKANQQYLDLLSCSF